MMGLQASSKSCKDRSGGWTYEMRDERHLFWCVRMKDICFQVGMFVMNAKCYSPIIAHCNLVISVHAKKERSKQSPRGGGCMLYPEG